MKKEKQMDVPDVVKQHLRNRLEGLEKERRGTQKELIKRTPLGKKWRLKMKGKTWIITHSSWKDSKSGEDRRYINVKEVK